MDTKFIDEFVKMQNEMNRFMEHLQKLSKRPTGFSTSAWVPQVNIYENEKVYILLAELPGVNPEKIQVTVHDNHVVLKGSKRPTVSVQNARCQHMEIPFGPFTRDIPLPEPVDAERVEANYEHGCLEIVAPKMSQTDQKKEITVKSRD